MFCILCHKLNTQRNAIVYWQWKQVREMKHQSSESFHSVFLHVTLVLPHSKKTFLAWTEYSGSKSWLTKYAWLFESIRGVQQLFCWFYKDMKRVFLLSNQRKELQRPKASYNSIPVEGKVEGSIGDWLTICWTNCFTLGTERWKYVWINM